jgi:hypothetical protein
MSAFVREDGVVYHSYSTYARGLDGLWGMHQWLDRTTRGRITACRPPPAAQQPLAAVRTPWCGGTAN